jgi:hypothetical protein
MKRPQTYHAFSCSSRENLLKIASRARTSGLYVSIFDERCVVVGPLNLVRGSAWHRLICAEAKEIYSSDFPSGAKALLRSQTARVQAA